MKRLTLALFLFLPLLSFADNAEPWEPAVGAMSPDIFHVWFLQAKVDADGVLALKRSAQGPDFKSQSGTDPAEPSPPGSVTHLQLGKAGQVYDAGETFKFIPPPDPKHGYLFLVEETNNDTQNIRVGLLALTLDDPKNSGRVKELPLKVDCRRCLERLEREFTSGSFVYKPQ